MLTCGVIGNISYCWNSKAARTGPNLGRPEGREELRPEETSAVGAPTRGKFGQSGGSGARTIKRRNAAPAAGGDALVARNQGELGLILSGNGGQGRMGKGAGHLGRCKKRGGRWNQVAATVRTQAWPSGGSQHRVAKGAPRAGGGSGGCPGRARRATKVPRRAWRLLAGGGGGRVGQLDPARVCFRFMQCFRPRRGSRLLGAAAAGQRKPERVSMDGHKWRRLVGERLESPRPDPVQGGSRLQYLRRRRSRTMAVSRGGSPESQGHSREGA